MSSEYFQFVKASYTSDGQIELHARDERDNKLTFYIHGFEPYFYVDQDQSIPQIPEIKDSKPVDKKNLDGKQVIKITVDHPKSVPKVREMFQTYYEADIPFIRRFMIDTGLYGGFTVDSVRKTLHYTQVHPDPRTRPPLTMFCDIEVDAPEGTFPSPYTAEYPVCGICVWDSRNQVYLTFLLDESIKVVTKSSKINGHNVVTFKTESDLLEMFNEWISNIKPDILTGWNFVKFDWEYLTNRMEQFKLKLFRKGIEVFDLLTAYAKVNKRLGNRLKEVVIQEKITDEVVSSEYHAEFYRQKDKTKFITYNQKDVEYCVEIDKKYNLLKYFWEIKNVAGMDDITDTPSNSIVVDTVTLREAKEMNLVLPSPTPREKRVRKRFQGAVVFESPNGIFQNVGIYDMSRFYPNIVISFKISPDQDRILMPNVCKRLTKARDDYDEQLKKADRKSKFYEAIENKQTAVKYLLNSVWGFIGYSGSRIYRRELAAMVAAKAREGLQLLKHEAERASYEVLYGDTDSIFIKHRTADVSESDTIAGFLNDALEMYCIENKIEKNLSLKLDQFFSSVIFTGAMKRYAGWVTFENNKPVNYIKVRGYETRRRDTSETTRVVQKRVFEDVLRGKPKEEISAYLKEIIDSIYAGEVPPNRLAITTQLKNPITIKQTSYYYKASYLSNKHLGANIKQGDQVKLLFVKQVPGLPQTAVLAYVDASQIPEGTIIDYDTIIEKTIKKKVDKVLSFADIDWSRIIRKTDVMTAWS